MVNYLFGFGGRIGRKGWWGGVGAQFLVFLVGLILVGALSLISGNHAQMVEEGVSGAPLYVMFGMFLAAWWIYIATSVKRLHDLGKSGFTLLIYMIIGVVLTLVASVISGMMMMGVVASAKAPQDMGATLIIVTLLYLAASAPGMWLLVLLGFIGGERGQNRYGPPVAFSPQKVARVFEEEEDDDDQTAQAYRARLKRKARQNSRAAREGTASPRPATQRRAGFGRRGIA